MNVSGRRLLHLHGICREDGSSRLDEERTVLTDVGYDVAYGPAFVADVLAAAITGYSMLLIGTSLTDWQIRLLFQEVRDRERELAERHHVASTSSRARFALVPCDGLESAEAAEFTWPGGPAIEPIFYIDTDHRHTALKNSINWLVEATSQPFPRGRYDISE